MRYRLQSLVHKDNVFMRVSVLPVTVQVILYDTIYVVTTSTYYRFQMYPDAIVFDLDYTLWPCWCDTHIAMPLKRILKNCVVDAVGFRLELYDDVERIFEKIKEQEIPIIAASRTDRPDIAKKLLSLFQVGDMKMIDLFSSLQWGQGSKKRHLARAVQELNLVSSLEGGRIVLFDDEIRNRDVEQLGCKFCYVSDNQVGLTISIFEDGIESWCRQHQLF